MIEHVVLFRMHEVYKDELNGLKERLDALENTIDVVQRIETGLNFSERSDAYDLILKVYVKDKPALQQYVAHPEHQKVLALIKKVVAQTAVVDFFKD